jgi:hypothetical protein
LGRYVGEVNVRMNYSRWKIVCELGRGGQAKVFFVQGSTLIFNALDGIMKSVKSLPGTLPVGEYYQEAKRLAESVRTYSSTLDGKAVTVLKV